MRYLNVVLNSLCDLLLFPFRVESPWPGMMAVSCVTAALFVWVIRDFSDQRSLKKQKGRMFARALELLLFRHDMIVSVTAFPRIAAANLSYFASLLKPVAVAMIPSVLLLIQLACWFEYRPFKVGEPVLVSATFSEELSILSDSVRLTASDGLTIETDGLRIPSLHQMDWRLRAAHDGTQSVDVVVGEDAVPKDVVVGIRLARISDQRVRAGFWNELLHPGEDPLARNGPVERIRVQYPRRQLLIAGWDIPWVIAFLVLVMLFGLIFGRVFRVSF